MFNKARLPVPGDWYLPSSFLSVTCRRPSCGVVSYFTSRTSEVMSRLVSGRLAHQTPFAVDSQTEFPACAIAKPYSLKRLKGEGSHHKLSENLESVIEFRKNGRL